MASRPRRLAMALAGVFVLVTGLTLVGSPAGARFVGTTSNTGSTMTSHSDFDTGSMSTWGGQMQLVPQQVGTATTWTQSSIGTVSDCEIRSPGTLWCSGRNGYGQLGVGDYTSRATPTQVGTATNWTFVDNGDIHTCGLRSDSTLWCWGYGGAGALGNGSGSWQTSPVQVTSPSATGWSQLSVGWNTNCALRSDSSMYCWGDNPHGQSGVGYGTSNFYTPQQVTVPAATGWTNITAGDRNLCALRTNALYCWGNNDNGSLGTGDYTSSGTPVQVPGTTWSSLGLGRYTVCGIKTNGTLWCWGYNPDGQVGNGGSSNVPSPVQIGSLTTWQKVVGGQWQMCATQTNGTLWCWGLNNQGQVGDGTTTSRNVPTQITTPAATGWTLTVMGVTADRSCATRSDGTLWCWGYFYRNTYTPTPIDETTTWHQPVNGTDYSCALRSTGALYCWGRNDNGQLGDGTTTSHPAPAQVGSSTLWTSLAAGQRHTCGVRSDTTLWCWGYNGWGQLGIDSTTDSSTPVQVTTPSATGWTTISAGNIGTCGIRTGGSMYCWGVGSTGSLGNGTTPNNQNTPTLVTSPTANPWTAVSVGNNFTCGLQSTALYCWGTNQYGNLGIGNTTQQNTPALVAGSWSMVSGGGVFACGIKTAGTLWCWGGGGEGELGNGGGDASSPAQVGSLSSWRTVTTGNYFTCGTQTGRSVWCWGQNGFGQLGVGDIIDHNTPQQITSATGRLVVAGSMSYTASLILPPWPGL